MAADVAADHFSLLGLERRFDLDRDDLEHSYLELSARYHPDRFVGASDRELREAMERSAALNEAYQTLRDPVTRVEYMVKLAGVDLDSDDPEHGAPRMDQAFLIEMLERRERLEELRGRDPAQLDAMLDDVEAEADEVLNAAVAAIGTDEVARAAHALVTHRYLQRLLDELEDARDGV